jgi:TonB family protein
MVSRYDVPYRAVARRKHLHGVAIVELIIGSDGSICAARVLIGLDPDFDRAALSALKRWRFVPAMSHAGKPVTAAFDISVKAE